jgi:hypothetical protein
MRKQPESTISAANPLRAPLSANAGFVQEVTSRGQSIAIEYPINPLRSFAWHAGSSNSSFIQPAPAPAAIPV